MKYAIRFLMFVPALLSVCVLFAQTAAEAPVSVPAPAVSEGSQEFDLKIKAYEAVMVEIQALKADFDKAYQAQDSAKMTEIQNAAAPLIQKAEQAFAAVVPAANAAYGSSDGTNEKLNQFMLVYANYLLSMDEYDEAFSLFKTFLSKGMHKKHPEIFEMAGVSAFGANNFTAAKQCFAYAEKAGAPLSQQANTYAKSITEYYEKEWARELQLRKEEAQTDNLPRVLIRTTAGDMTVELFENEAPNTVKSFVTLVEKGFYTNLPFHRVLQQFMAQGGCPKGDGTGGPGYTIPEEFSKTNARKHFRGSLAMARSMDPNSAGSQFYISFLPTQFLDGQYTVFGRVIDGMDVLGKIVRIDPERPYPGQVPTKIIEMKVLRKQAHDYSNFESKPE